MKGLQATDSSVGYLQPSCALTYIDGCYSRVKADLDLLRFQPGLVRGTCTRGSCD
jgi:hypothetical protein